MVWFHLLRPMQPIPNSTKITVFTEATAAKCFCSSARTWISARISTAPQCSLLPTRKGCLSCLWGHHNLCRQDPDGIHFSRNTGTLIASSSKKTNLTYDQGHMSSIVLAMAMWALFTSFIYRLKSTGSQVIALRKLSLQRSWQLFSCLQGLWAILCFRLVTPELWMQEAAPLSPLPFTTKHPAACWLAQIPSLWPPHPVDQVMAIACYNLNRVLEALYGRMERNSRYLILWGAYWIRNCLTQFFTWAQSSCGRIKAAY